MEIDKRKEIEKRKIGTIKQVDNSEHISIFFITFLFMFCLSKICPPSYHLKAIICLQSKTAIVSSTLKE